MIVWLWLRRISCRGGERGGEAVAEEREGGVVFLITNSPLFTWMITGSHLVLEEIKEICHTRSEV